ncbi:hypothetical protein PanWU01x14_236420 [Parasponia andersonii]|uniref:Transmembrane protein n=1 Tax=Parasponia andersonii TaxID=3476 RepID=A0A2P5BIC4_PARAD|nr:hypothetical protein PanWU01x14_236420 [Parasponia andersonii]
MNDYAPLDEGFDGSDRTVGTCTGVMQEKDGSLSGVGTGTEESERGVRRSAACTLKFYFGLTKWIAYLISEVTIIPPVFVFWLRKWRGFSGIWRYWTLVFRAWLVSL